MYFTCISLELLRGEREKNSQGKSLFISGFEVIINPRCPPDKLSKVSGEFFCLINVTLRSQMGSNLAFSLTFL